MEAMEVYEKIRRVRRAGRPTAQDYINAIFENFTELHGDRRFADDKAIVSGLAWLGKEPVTVIGIEKGHSIEERMERNFGSASPEGYRKAMRLAKQAEKFHRPVICFVDTQGANPRAGAEERGQGQAIAENLYELMTLKTPVISIVIGEGGSGGALALAVADRVWMLENAYYSVVSPEGCASILFKDATRAPEAAAHLKLTAEDLLSMEIIEEIIREPEDFTNKDAAKGVMKELKKMLEKTLHTLTKLPTEELLAARYEKYRKIGRPADEAPASTPAKGKRR